MPLPQLWAALQPHDPSSQRPRGFLILTRSPPRDARAASPGPSLLLSLDKRRHAEWGQLRDWLLALHLQRARGGMALQEEGRRRQQGEAEEEGFLRFLATLPRPLATLITPLSPVAAVLAQEEGGGEGEERGCAGPHTALKQLIAAIEVCVLWWAGSRPQKTDDQSHQPLHTHNNTQQAHPLFPLLTPDALAPLLGSRSETTTTTVDDEDEAAAEATRTASSVLEDCCSQFVRVERGGHALLVLYLALGDWAATGESGSRVEAEGAGAGAGDGERLLAQEVNQLRVKLQALAMEMVGRLPAGGLEQG